MLPVVEALQRLHRDDSARIELQRRFVQLRGLLRKLLPAFEQLSSTDDQRRAMPVVRCGGVRKLGEVPVHVGPGAIRKRALLGGVQDSRV